MLTFKRFSCAAITAALLSVGTSHAAIAQELIELGTTASDKPAFLQQNRRKSSGFKIFHAYGNGVAVTSYNALCADGGFRVKSIDLYDEFGNHLRHERINEKEVPEPGSVSARALAIVCKSINAYGW